jgi:hypothetical protein
MTSPIPADSTGSQEGAAPATAEDARAGARGGPADRMDAAPGSVGLAGAGADGETAAREQVRKDLGERAEGAGEQDATGLEQAAALGETDAPASGSLGERGQ